MALRSRLRTTFKKFRALVEAQPEQAQAGYGAVTSLLDRAARKKLIHPNKAARLKSRLHFLLRAARDPS